MLLLTLERLKRPNCVSPIGVTNPSNNVRYEGTIRVTNPSNNVRYEGTIRGYKPLQQCPIFYSLFCGYIGKISRQPQANKAYPVLCTVLD